MMQFLHRFEDYPKPITYATYLTTLRRPLTFQPTLDVWREDGRLRFVIGFGRALSLRHWADPVQSDFALWIAGRGLLITRCHR